MTASPPSFFFQAREKTILLRPTNSLISNPQKSCMGDWDWDFPENFRVFFLCMKTIIHHNCHILNALTFLNMRSLDFTKCCDNCTLIRFVLDRLQIENHLRSRVCIAGRLKLDIPVRVCGQWDQGVSRSNLIELKPNGHCANCYYHSRTSTRVA